MSTGNRKLVFVLVHDALIGVKFEARVAELMDDGTFSLNHYRLDPFNYRNFDVAVGDQEKVLLKSLREITYDKLVQNFSKVNSDLPDLLRMKGDDFFKRIFRPYVERRIVFQLSHCRDYNIPVYQLFTTGAISEQPYVYAKEPARVSYHFRWTPENLTYAIRVTAGGEPVVLHNPSLIIVTDQPAWIAYRGALYTMEDVNGNKIKPFLTKSSLVVPRQTEQKYFSTFIRGLLRQSAISQSGFRVEERKAPPVPVALLSVDWQNDPVMILKYRYGNHEIMMDHPDPRLVEMDDAVHPPSFAVDVRDLDYEEGIRTRLLALGLRQKGGSGWQIIPPAGIILDPMASLILFAREHFEWFRDAGIELRQDPGVNYLLEPPVIHSEISDQRDWFDLEITIEVGDYRIPFRLLKDWILNGKKEYRTPDGAIFLIPDEWFSRFRGVFLFGKNDGKKIRINKIHFGSLDKAVESSSLTGPGSPAEILRRLFAGDEVLSGHAAGLLRPYQILGVRWLLGLEREGFGGCLADDMGLGKTIQMLAYLEQQRINGSGRGRVSLVVMPVSLLQNWESEIAKFTPGRKVYRLSGPMRNAEPEWLQTFDIVLTSYGTLRNDIDLLEQTEFGWLVLDESQHAKNADSITFKALSRIRAVSRLAMTGTPVENSLEDLWSQMSLVNPGMLGSRHWFREHFLRSGILDREEESSLLRELVRPFILRRTKQAVAPELPTLTEEIRYCEPSPEQRSVYESRKSEIRNYLVNRFREPIDSATRILVLQSLMKLRLIANHPVMADPAYDSGSGKLDEMIERIAEVVAEDHKVLVFSQFVKHLKIIGAALDTLGIPYLKMTGQDAAGKRAQMISRFQTDDSLPVFLVSLKAGGVGLNLTSADYVFLADPWWNPAIEQQAISRAHRIGQEKPVFAYRFITTGTIEEKILQLQERKQNLADIFVNRNALNLIEPEDVLELLS